jgi:hypothetical protein
MDLSKINYLAVLVAALTAFIIGSLWYSVLFSKTWMQESGITKEKARQSNMFKIFGLSFLLQVIICFNLAAFLGPQSDFKFGLLAGALTGIGWVAASLGIQYLFEGRSLKLFLINAGYQAITYTIAGGIIGAWH